MPAQLDGICVRPEAPLSQAIQAMEASGAGIVLVVDENGRLQGTVTDGDIRRAILAGTPMTQGLAGVMNPRPTTLPEGTSREEILRRLQALGLHHMPLLDREGRVVQLVLLRDLIATPQYPNYVVIMAGGMGRRLLPLTEQTPKPMLQVGDRPMLQLIIERFKRFGFHRFLIAVNYLAAQIEQYFGNGSSLAVEIQFLREGSALGTGGAIRLGQSFLHDPFFVVNGDVLTGVDLESFWRFHFSTGSDLTVGTKPYRLSLPYGVLHTRGHDVKGIEEKPTYSFLVNAGIYVVHPQLIRLIPEGVRFHMTSLIESAIRSRFKVVAFPIVESWLDVGYPDDYQRAKQLFGDDLSTAWSEE